jgi:flagellar motor switch protein FliM
MESPWTKADFKTVSQCDGAGAEQLRLTNESLARDLAMNVSAFLRSPINVTCSGASNVMFSQFIQDEDRSCFVAVFTRQTEQKLVVRADYNILFPLIGIALGAQAGAFASPPRKPTEIELQLVMLLVRMVVSEALRAWTPLAQTELELLTVETEQTPSRALPSTALVCAVSFQITVGECGGNLTIAVPASLFAERSTIPQAELEQRVASSENAQQIIGLMMSAQVRLDIWLDPSQIRLTDLLQLQAGQIIKLDHAAEQRVVCTLNGKPGFDGQIVSTGSRRGFQIDNFAV